MSLKVRIDTEMKEAMRAKEQVRLDVLRQIKTAIKMKEVEGAATALGDPDILKIIAQLAKQRGDSITQFEQGGRQDLADKERAELALLQAFLPAALSETELRNIVAAAAVEVGATGPHDMGKVMKAVLAKTAGAADGKLVSELVKAQLLK